MSEVLRGRRIAVTRPRAQAAGLAAQIAAQGGEPIVFPLLEISAVGDPAPLEEAVSRLYSYALVIFISPNAVAFSMPAILAAGSWPNGVPAAVIGQGSLAALASYGLATVIAPSVRFDSEGMLDLPELQPERVAGQRVLILRGNGGRELLAETLRARGAEVELVSCYHRSAPTSPEPLQSLLHAGALDAVTVSSSEGLRHLLELLDRPARVRLEQTPLFVPHPRIAEQAERFGLPEVILTGPADAGIIEALCAHRWVD